MFNHQLVDYLLGGNPGSSTSNLDDIIDYVTFASTGNATDFGDLSAYREIGGSITQEVVLVTKNASIQVPLM